MPDRKRLFAQLLWIVLIAFTVRLLVMAFLLPEQLDPSRDHWRFGYETGRIARSLAEGHGFSSPLFGNTGPTAWMTPIYPLLVATAFKLLGVYTKPAAIALLTFNALVSALTCIPIALIAKLGFGNRAARWSAWAWALCPYGIYFPVERIWETWLATLLLCILFLFTLRLEEERRLAPWLGFGALWGIAALTSPAVLTVLPFLAGWLIYRRVCNREPWFAVNVIAALAFLAVVSPWFLRNYEVFHRFIPFRDNLGIVLRLGTRGNANHWAQYQLGPWHNEQEWNEFQQEGELRYMADKKQEAFASIRHDPAWFATTTARRIVFLWTGYWSFDRDYLKEEPLDPPNIFFCTALTVLALLGLRRALRLDFSANLPYALVLFSFPLIYYITSPEAYYRRPIDPFFVILAVVAVLPELKRPKSVLRLSDDRSESLVPVLAATAETEEIPVEAFVRRRGLLS